MNASTQPKILFWNRLSVRLSLLIVGIVLTLAVVSGLLFFRAFSLAQIDATGTKLPNPFDLTQLFQAEQANKILRATIVNLLSVFMLMLVMATFFSRNLLIKPIEALLKGTQDLSEGHLGVTLPIEANSELGILGMTFNQMSQNIALQNQELVATNEALRKSEQLLEERVSQRTEQLEALLELSSTIALGTDLNPLLRQTFAKLKTVVDYTEVSVFLLEKQTIRLLYYQGPVEQDIFIKHWSLGDIGEARSVIDKKEVLLVRDTTTETNNENSLDISTDTVTDTIINSTTNFSEDFMRFTIGYHGEPLYHMATWLGVPIIVQNKLLGMMTMEHVKVDAYDETDCDIVTAFASQVALAIENDRLYRETKQNAALEERRHLARELHDSVSQALFGISLGIDAAIKTSEKDPSKLEEPLNYVKNLAQGGLAEMRSLIFELRPESLEQEGLKVALAKQAEALKMRHQLDIQYHAEDEPELSFAAKQELYRIAQEALHNVVKHAHASLVTMTLTEDDSTACLKIADNGIGFDDSQDFPGSLGLTSMRERSEALGGYFYLNSKENDGTSLTICVPKAITGSLV